MAVEPDRAVNDLESFLAERGQQLLRTAVLLAGGKEAGEDLLQAGLERLIRRWRTIEGDPEGYLRRVLYHLAIDGWRQQEQLRVRLRLVRNSAASAAEDPMADVDRRDSLVRLMMKLPARQRAVIVARYWEELTEAEAAAVLGCSVGTVKSAASRGPAAAPRTQRGRSARRKRRRDVEQRGLRAQAGGHPMNDTKLVQQLRADMERETRDVCVPPGIGDRALRRNRRRRTIRRAAMAGGAGVTAAAITVAGLTGAFGAASGPSAAPGDQTVAYVLARVKTALNSVNSANFVLYEKIAFAPSAVLERYPTYDGPGGNRPPDCLLPAVLRRAVQPRPEPAAVGLDAGYAKMSYVR